MTDELKKFYAVDTTEDLIKALCYHIEMLQKQLRSTEQSYRFTSKVRFA